MYRIDMQTIPLWASNLLVSRGKGRVRAPEPFSNNNALWQRAAGAAPHWVSHYFNMHTLEL